MDVELDVRSACADTVSQYGHARDAVNLELYASLFTHDAQFTIQGHTTAGLDALLQGLEQRGVGPKTRHLVGSVAITPTGPDTATGSSYAIVIEAPADRIEPTPAWTSERVLALVTYADEFRIVGRDCLIASRTAHIDLERSR